MICFPEADRNLDAQLSGFWRILSIVEAKISFFLCLKCSGSSRYFLVPPIFKPVSPFTLSFWELGFLEENVIDHFVRLLLFACFLIFGKDLLQCLVTLCIHLCKNSVSSAKRRWFTFGMFWDKLIPGIIPLSCAFWHYPDSTFVHWMKRYG